MRRNLIAGKKMAIDTYPRPTWRQILLDHSRLRAKVGVCIFRRNTALDGMAAQSNIFLPEMQWQPGGNAYLLLDQIDARHHLGHGMLYLQTGIHLHEIVTILLIYQELERASVAISYLLYSADGLHAHLIT